LSAVQGAGQTPAKNQGEKRAENPTFP